MRNSVVTPRMHFFAGAGSDILLFYELVIHDQSVMSVGNLLL